MSELRNGGHYVVMVVAMGLGVAVVAMVVVVRHVGRCAVNDSDGVLAG